MPQKVKMEVQSSVAANSQTDNVFTGKRFERAPFSGFLLLSGTGSATGLTCELNVGGRSASPADPMSAQNRAPILPDDIIIDEVECYQGELIQVTVRNTTAGALTAFLRCELAEAQEY